MKDYEEVVVTIVVFLSLAIGALLGEGAGFFRGAHYERVKAVQAGAGRWVTDPRTGETGFEHGTK